MLSGRGSMEITGGGRGWSRIRLSCRYATRTATTPAAAPTMPAIRPMSTATPVQATGSPGVEPNMVDYRHRRQWAEIFNSVARRSWPAGSRVQLPLWQLPTGKRDRRCHCDEPAAIIRPDDPAAGCIPHQHGAVNVGDRQLTVGTERHPEHAAAAGNGEPTSRPVAGSHSRTVPSACALASSLPSGLNATAFAPPVRAEPRWSIERRRPGQAPGPTTAPSRPHPRWPGACRRD